MRIGNYFTQMVKDKSGKESNLLLIILSTILSTNLFGLNRTLPQIYINEFLASNSNSSYDTDFISFCDWIELYNAMW